MYCVHSHGAKVDPSGDGIHVGPVHIDLPAVLVNHMTDFANAFFKNAVGRWVGDHESTELIGVLGTARFEVVHLDVRGLPPGRRSAFTELGHACIA